MFNKMFNKKTKKFYSFLLIGCMGISSMQPMPISATTKTKNNKITTSYYKKTKTITLKDKNGIKKVKINNKKKKIKKNSKKIKIKFKKQKKNTNR